MTFPSQHIGVSINRPPSEVYRFASDPRNLPRWASGLGGSISNVDGDWVAESPMGAIRIRFADENALGVLDHDVTLPSGETFYNPMRVFSNGDGSELVFTLYRQPDVTDEAFGDDARTITRDLAVLKALMEDQAPDTTRP